MVNLVGVGRKEGLEYTSTPSNGNELAYFPLKDVLDRAIRDGYSYMAFAPPGRLEVKLASIRIVRLMIDKDKYRWLNRKRWWYGSSSGTAENYFNHNTTKIRFYRAKGINEAPKQIIMKYIFDKYKRTKECYEKEMADMRAGAP